MPATLRAQSHITAAADARVTFFGARISWRPTLQGSVPRSISVKKARKNEPLITHFYLDTGSTVVTMVE